MEITDKSIEDAYAAYDKEDYKLSIEITSHLMENQKSYEPFFLMGLHYKEGYGVEKNLEKAIKLWKKASKLGSVDAQYALTEMTQHTASFCK